MLTHIINIFKTFTNKNTILTDKIEEKVSIFKNKTEIINHEIEIRNFVLNKILESPYLNLNNFHMIEDLQSKLKFEENILQEVENYKEGILKSLALLESDSNVQKDYTLKNIYNKSKEATAVINTYIEKSKIRNDIIKNTISTIIYSPQRWYI